jgi:hypothetical protein
MKKTKFYKGQALISLLIFSVIAIAIAAVSMTIVMNSRQKTYLSQEVLNVENAALSGLELGLMAIIRNPSYIGESLSVNGSDVSIQVTDTQSYKNIHVTAAAGNATFKIEAQVKFENNRLIILSKKAVY